MLLPGMQEDVERLGTQQAVNLGFDHLDGSVRVALHDNLRATITGSDQ